jgi:hypothetical protein
MSPPYKGEMGAQELMGLSQSQVTGQSKDVKARFTEPELLAVPIEARLCCFVPMPCSPFHWGCHIFER